MAVGAGTAVVERVPGGIWQVRIPSRSAPEHVKSFARKSNAEDWRARREAEIAKRQLVDYREADRNTLGEVRRRLLLRGPDRQRACRPSVSTCRCDLQPVSTSRMRPPCR